jgi:integrase
MLTDHAIKNIKPSKKITRCFDSKGLYIEVSPNGGKWWRLKYRFLGKEKRLSLGVYPEISLKKARELRDENRKLIAEGIDPSENRKKQKLIQSDNMGNTFESIAREWLLKHGRNWVASHSERTLRRLERDIFPWIGKKPISTITAHEVLVCVQRIENRGALETAHRALQNCGQVMRFAVATARLDRDPTADLKGALPPVKEKHFAAITDPTEVAELLKAFDGYEGTFIVKAALKLAPLVFVRPGELRTAKWADINFEKSEWSYFVSKTKSQHIVPLSKQALEILNEIKPLTGNSPFVFPSSRNFHRPMSDNAILSALRRLEIPKETMTGHGFRAMARTILDEVLGFRPDYIEHQLAHAVRDPNGRAYNRTAHLKERHLMMRAWADYLDSLKLGVSVIGLKKAKVS